MDKYYNNERQFSFVQNTAEQSTQPICDGRVLVGICTSVGRQWLVVFYLQAYHMFDIKIPGLTQQLLECAVDSE